MLIANAFTVRSADEPTLAWLAAVAAEPTLAWLAAVAAEPALRLPALIGDVDGAPAAAISLVDGRVVADPFRPSPGLVAHLRLHRSGWRTGGRRDAARRHLRAAIPFMV